MVMRHINKELELGFHRLMQLLYVFFTNSLASQARDEETE